MPKTIMFSVWFGIFRIIGIIVFMLALLLGFLEDIVSASIALAVVAAISCIPFFWRKPF